MNPTLYTQLAPLGFAEWLEKNELKEIADEFEFVDQSEIDSIERTGLNALAFRWLREEKKLDIYVRPFMGQENNKNTVCIFDFNKKQPKTFGTYPTHPLAEHEVLNKALEIISCSPDKQGEQNKGGENGMD